MSACGFHNFPTHPIVAQRDRGKHGCRNINLKDFLKQSSLTVGKLRLGAAHGWLKIVEKARDTEKSESLNRNVILMASSEGSRKGRSHGCATRSNEALLLEDIFHLERIDQVSVTFSDTHLVWHSVEDDIQNLDARSLLCCGTTHKDVDGHVPVAEIFAVKSSGFGPVTQAKPPLCGDSLPTKQFHRVEVHTFLRSDSKWIPKVYVFGHTSPAVVQQWTQRIQSRLHEDSHRPKTLLVFVNPYGGKRSGIQTWEQVAPFFELAKIKVTVVETERAGHARELMERATKDELDALDGVIVVGGDGTFNEVVNGLVMHRHKAQAAIMPGRLSSFSKTRTQQIDTKVNAISDEQGGLKQLLIGNVSTSQENSSDEHPLLQNRALSLLIEASIGQEGKVGTGTGGKICSSGVESERIDTAVNDSIVQVKDELRGQAGGGFSGVCDASESIGTPVDNTELENPSTTLLNSNPNLRIGLIPAGSTDTVVISTTGARDSITSALHVILGDRMPLDLVRITGWKNHSEGSLNGKPEVRYAASFTGYGFYGDVMRESEELRWMGPARYDLAGFKVFMNHKSYEAEVSFLDVSQNQPDPKTSMPQGPWIRNTSSQSRNDARRKVVCLANCAICASGFDFSHVVNSESDSEGVPHAEGMQAPTWKTVRSKFQSVGAAVMSCRNDKAPEGVAAHAHLADGLLHLILIRECSRLGYLRQLLRLTRRGADPFKFPFVEYHKTPLFTFSSRGDEESVWSVDGELLQAVQLEGQVFRGLVNLFARGPESA
ncbi:ceramide kinase isoform X3 [Physcomitrium patens]|uniref:ceramide kinase isoform X3 n=1 Tax=Physcomitrium patens TaxID=3218 RepID=UPI000D17DFE7|nr:ceramide kinase-like isoform X3 [Physcomitrium patens]|eukprot:XP_024368535.1 ceramide kinase-like isoform X3 [Physcomitrella patens]